LSLYLTFVSLVEPLAQPGPSLALCAQRGRRTSNTHTHAAAAKFQRCSCSYQLDSRHTAAIGCARQSKRHLRRKNKEEGAGGECSTAHALRLVVLSSYPGTGAIWYSISLSNGNSGQAALSSSRYLTYHQAQPTSQTDGRPASSYQQRNGNDDRQAANKRTHGGEFLSS
jgi:hypothetical protein